MGRVPEKFILDYLSFPCPLVRRVETDYRVWYFGAHEVSKDDKEVYIAKYGNYLKIGRTNHLPRRIGQLKRGLPTDDLEVLATIHTKESDEWEKYLHTTFYKYRTKKRTNCEWFKIDFKIIDEFLKAGVDG